VPGLLHFSEHHDAEQIAHMQARRRAVETDIAGNNFALGEVVESRFIRALMHVTAGGQLMQEIGFGSAHAGAARIEQSV
jgi:hypothetical protein